MTPTIKELRKRQWKKRWAAFLEKRYGWVSPEEQQRRQKEIETERREKAEKIAEEELQQRISDYNSSLVSAVIEIGRREASR